MHGSDHDGDAWLRRHAGRSDVNAAVAAHDWASTPLGPPGTWAPALRAAAELCLTSRFPLMLAAGPELVMLYNAGYRHMIGDKHPAALGAPASEVFAEVWDVIGPLFRRVLGEGEATWAVDQQLLMDRHGFPEETWFTYSYSPVLDGDRVVGVLDIATETTAQVVTDRRLAAVNDLAASLLGAVDIDEVRERAAAALARWSSEVSGAEIPSRRTAPDDDVLRVLDGDWAAGRPARRVAVPIRAAGRARPLVLELNPHRPFDAGARAFVEVVATTVGTAIDAARRRASTLRRERATGDRLQRAMLQLDLPADGTVAVRYRPASDELTVGGDWYDVVELEGARRALVVGDCVGHGLDAAIAMGQLRSAARALLLAGAGPAAALTALDLFAGQVAGAGTATAAIVVIDGVAATATYAVAGHPPPLVLGGDGARWLDGGRGVPLAVAPLVRQDAVAHLAPGDVVVLYTDGLVERRGEHLDDGLERLRRAAERLADRPVEALADELAALPGEGTADDVAVVVHRLAT